MNKQEFQAVLSKHQLWLDGDLNGMRADLRAANLHGADLSGADLRGANLRCANLRGAYLYAANLHRADLRCANLHGADLRGANLYGADLYAANLHGADLRGADLYAANLRCANLRGANLRGANLRDANLHGADLPPFQICPEVGSFYAWKKTTKGVIKIQIPAKAKRTSSLVGSKCRAEYIKVITCGGKSPARGNLDYSQKGSIIKADSYDDDIRIECTNGIHFFMTKQEAEQWARSSGERSQIWDEVEQELKEIKEVKK